MLNTDYRSYFSAEEYRFLQETREFMRSEIAPYAELIDREDRVPQEVFDLLKPYLALTIPKAYGGLGHEEMYDCISVQELGYVCPALVTYLEIAQLFGHALRIGGSEAQRQRYLPQIVEGVTGAYALTDHTPGSDPANMFTTATPSGDGWHIKGRKRFITFANIAEMMVLFARDTTAGGLSAFVLERPYEGLTFVRRNEWNGLRGHEAWEFDLDLHSANIVGEPGQGINIALQVLNYTRTSLACGHVGLADAALDVAMQFAKEREVGGKAIFKHQSISFALVEARAKVESARLLAYRAARLCEQGKEHRGETAMAKFSAAEALIEAVTVANRVLGGYSGNLDYASERHLRDAYTWVAAHGTIEIQKMTAARAMFSSR